jgi:hypothetical protein
MTIALAVIVNAAAAGVLLALLTAVMRLPYYLPTSPHSAATARAKEGAPRVSQPAATGRRPSDRHGEPAYSR